MAKVTLHKIGKCDDIVPIPEQQALQLASAKPSLHCQTHHHLAWGLVQSDLLLHVQMLAAQVQHDALIY